MSYRVVEIASPDTVVFTTRRLSEAVAVASDDPGRGVLHRGCYVPFLASAWQEAHPKITLVLPKSQQQAKRKRR